VVNFLPNDSHKISEFSDSQVSLVADFLIAHRDKSVKVVGHTNFHRNIFYAENLGLERAKQIREILIKKGVNEEQIYLESKGMREMLVSPDNRKNTFLNRRVEIILK
jgi:outer membrane protein OmpA-like peptidoglycan-associated protein